MQASVAWSSQSSVIRLPQVHRHSLRLVALGDSLVYGYGDPEGGGWVERLRRQWMSPASPGHVVYNLGVRGNRTVQVRDRLEHEFRHRGELRNRVPDVIILSVGVNDSAKIQSPQGRNYTDFEEFQPTINSLLDSAQNLCPVLFVGMVPVDETKMPFQDCLYYDRENQYLYKEATRLACLERNIPYLDIFQNWLKRGEMFWKSRLSADGLHPNTLGYQTLLDDVLNWEPIFQMDRSHHSQLI